ncbi:MAG: hypothetical protein LBP26_03675 [Clostridiales bacterium]|jgi:maltose-binding protein MalE|nr:hypothetical protein [Clostridiales bacterium]
MRKIKQIAVFILVAVLGAPTWAGCRTKLNEMGNEEVDPTMSQLYVLNYNGGFGSDWLMKARDRFEETYKDTSFEDGKKGVQIMIEPTKELSGTLKMAWKVRTFDVAFAESLQGYNDWVREGLLYDITDAVTEPLTEYGDAKSVKDKLNAAQDSFFKVDGKYYGIPHYAGYGGIVYDRDLFDKNCLYLRADWRSYVTDVADSNQWADAFVAKLTDAKAPGPDGDAATDYDNGLPATYEEFFLLCNYIADIGLTPLTWTGQHYAGYFQFTQLAMRANYDGAEQTNLWTSLDGAATKLAASVTAVPGAAVGNVTLAPPLTINAANAVEKGPELYKGAGLYYADKFIETVFNTPKWYDPAKQFSPTHSHIDAQSDFLYSSLEPGQKDIAMLFESTWWESESNSVITRMTERYGERASKFNRNFQFMPLPHPTEAQIGQKGTILDSMVSLGMIRAGIPEWRAELGKKFLRFVNTDESLKEFTVTTNTTKALDYPMDEADLAKMSNFGRSVYDTQNRSDMAVQFSSNPLFVYNSQHFTIYALKTRINGTAYAPITGMHINKFTAEQVFNGYYAHGQDIFSKMIVG